MKKICALLAACAVATFSQSADAAFTLTIDDGSGPIDVTITDQGAGDASPLVGAISNTSVSIGVFDVVISTSLSKPIVGNPTNAELRLNVDWTASGAGTLVVTSTDDGFLPGVGEPSINISSSWTHNGDGSSSGITSLDGTPVLVSSPLSGVTDTEEMSVTIAPAPAVAYSLSNMFSIVTTGAGDGNFDVTTNAVVPEPTTMIMWGSFAAIGIPALIRRRRQAA